MGVSQVTTLPSEATGPVLRFPAGVVRGNQQDDLRVFRGIPYAMPPTGARRWRPPVPISHWEGVRDATRPGPACIQPPRRANSIYASELASTGEDCLSLDIWAPENAERLPVFVWFHGGSLIWGAGSEPMYDGASLARRSMVVVTVNYRLGVFGYLAHPELSAESPDGVSGNYGLLDQIEALKWIRRNIAAIGGDPDNVTIAGESAGALSVMYLMSAPSARGLFAKAIAQSAYMISAPELKQPRFGEEAAETIGARLAETIGARDIAALRSMDAQALAEAALQAGYLPTGTIDGRVLPRQIVDVFDRGEQAPVPLLAGFNSGEIRSLRFLMPQLPPSSEAYEAAIRSRYADLAERFLELYPPDDVEESVLAAIRDALHGWTAQRLVEKQAALDLPAYLYYFDHGYPAARDAGLHGFHGGEMPYLFGTADRTPRLWPAIPATSAAAALSQAIGDYWASFARTGAPSSTGSPVWAAYKVKGAYMHFEDAPRAANNLLPGMFDLHEEVVRRRRAAKDIPWNWNVGIAAPLPVVLSDS